MVFTYVYIPKDDDKKLDSEFYLIDVILLVLSVSKIKRFKSNDDKIIFHSTKEFYGYLEPLNLFDEFKEIVDDDVYIKNQKYEYCHKNCIYKIKAAISNNESYINLDHDFVIYNKDYLDLLKNRNKSRLERKDDTDDIFTDAKGLAKERDIPIISPSQANR